LGKWDSSIRRFEPGGAISPDLLFTLAKTELYYLTSHEKFMSFLIKISNLDKKFIENIFVSGYGEILSVIYSYFFLYTIKS
jgi:hypothetical protein